MGMVGEAKGVNCDLFAVGFRNTLKGMCPSGFFLALKVALLQIGAVIVKDMTVASSLPVLGEGISVGRASQGGWSDHMTVTLQHQEY